MLLGIEFPSGRLWPEREIRLSLMTGVSWLVVQSTEHVECGVVAGISVIERSIYRVARRHSQHVYV